MRRARARARPVSAAARAAQAVRSCVEHAYVAELVRAAAVGDVDVVDVLSLQARAAAVAADQGALLTRQTYASVYGAFCAFVGPDARADAFTAERVRAYRDELERAGRSPATIAKHLSALRTLAAALGTEDVRNVRGAKVARGEPRALSAEQYDLLLRMPDLRTTAGKRDVALLHLLGTAGLRRAEAAALLVVDVDEHPRADDARLRRAIAHSTPWWVTVRRGQARAPAPRPARARRPRRTHELGPRSADVCP